MGHTELQKYVATERGQYILSKALSFAANNFNHSTEAKEMAIVLIKYFPQFPELLNTHIVSDTILDTQVEPKLTYWEAMAEMAWSSTLPDE